MPAVHRGLYPGQDAAGATHGVEGQADGEKHRDDEPVGHDSEGYAPSCDQQRTERWELSHEPEPAHDGSQT